MPDKTRLKEIMGEMLTTENEDERITLISEAETIVNGIPDQEAVNNLQNEVLELTARNEMITKAYKERFKSSDKTLDDLNKEGKEDKEEKKIMYSDLPFAKANSEFKI